MILRYFQYCLLLVVLSFGYSTSKSQPLFVIEERADFVEVDQQQNIYLIAGSELKKYSQEGEQLYVFSDKISGTISVVDVSNPLRILVFFKESNRIVFLNQQLSPIGEICDLYNVLDREFDKVGLSSIAGFWAYERNQHAIVHVNNMWETGIETQNLTGWTAGSDILFVREHNQQLFVALAQKILVFDVYGSYLTTIHFKGVNFMVMVGGSLTYLSHKGYCEFNIQTRTERTVKLYGDIDVKNVILADDSRLYEVAEQAVKVYKKQHD